MVKLPRIPQAWKDQSAGTPQETIRARPDLNAMSEGILGGWQPPGWSLEGSGPGFLLDPETIAQIDFGDKGASPPIQAPVSIAGKLTQEGSYRFLPENGLNMNEHDGYRIAQAGGPLPYPLRRQPIPRFTPERIPGYRTERMDADGNVYDHLAEPSDIRGAMLDIAARGRQSQVGKDFELDKNAFNTPMLLDKKTQFWSAPDSFPLVGWRGDTYRTAQGKYYIDRNGDGSVDVKVYQDPKSNVTMIDYGDGAGFRPYDPKRVLPPPYVTPPLISPRRK